MALDRVNNQFLVPAYGNGGFRAFQLNEEGVPVDRRARFITSRESIYGRRAAPLPSAKEATFPGAGGLFDNTTGRFFTIDRFSNRILVYKSNPNQLGRFPSADFVIGQPDFTSTRRGLAPNRFGATSGVQLDEENQRLFVADTPNNRVMVFDIHPDRLTSDPRATEVIGQNDFESRDPGIGRSKINRPSSTAYDPVFKRLFVSDSGNNRVLIFDANPGNPEGFKEAIAVMGQTDFDSRTPRQALDDLKPGSLAYDYKNHRLFVAEGLQHRVMAYDAHPDRVGGPAKAIAVIGQPDAFSIHPAVSDTRVAMPRATVNSEAEKLYISEGYPAGNRVTVWDISPDNLKTGMLAMDVIGQETPEGGPDFFNRMAQGHLDSRSLAAARAVILDPVDNRLFVPDEYNHRVVIWQLDELNRITDRDAAWVLGQPNMNTSLMGAPNARNMTTPIGAAYDASTKRLFVGDGYHNRILGYDVAPGHLENGMAASIVIGQPDFESVGRTAGRSGINFGVRMGRGIGSSFLPMGFAIDEIGQRLFVADGENNRVLIYDIRRNTLRNGAEAIGILGQSDYQNTAPGSGANGLHDPGHLAYDVANERLFTIDAKNKRVLVFDVHPDRIENGASAISVIGKPDFEAPPPAGPSSIFGATPAGPPPISGDRFVSPNGIAHDPVQQLLYVSDGGGTFGIPADRILVFNVAPEKLENGSIAIATLGAPDAETPRPASWGGAEPNPGQFRVRDTRGIALDHENGRLFATGSFESRLIQFNFPRANWNYYINPMRVQSFGTLDASDLGGQSDPETLTVARLDTASGLLPQSVAIYSSTQQTVDQRSQRHSRWLINEAAVTPSLPVRRATVFIDGHPQRRHTLYAYNPGQRTSELTLTLRNDQGLVAREWKHTLPAGEQAQIEIEPPESAAPTSATLTVTTSTPVAMSAFRLSINGRGEKILSPAPMAKPSSMSDQTTIPYVVSGGGYHSEVLLINPTEELAKGTIAFYNETGKRGALGTRSDVLFYEIPPHSSYTISSDRTGPNVLRGYAKIKADAGNTPYSATLNKRWSGDVWTHENLVSGISGSNMQFAVDLRPTMIRHGEIDISFIIVNPMENEAANINLSLGGAEIISDSLLPGEQKTISLRETEGQNIHGIVSFSSDHPVTLTALQETLNIRSGTVKMELPPISEAAYFPYVPNGGGLSTEFRLANTSAQQAGGQLGFKTPSGEPAITTILR